MCRWLAYTGSPVLLEELLYKPKHSLIDQSLHLDHGRRDHQRRRLRRRLVRRPGHPGRLPWHRAHLERPQPARAGHARWPPPLVFAHIRASSGSAVQQTNCHPFPPRTLAVDAQRAARGLPGAQARPRPRRRPGPVPRDRGVDRLRAAVLPGPDLRAVSWIRANRPGNAEVEQLTRTVRAALNPSSDEARTSTLADDRDTSHTASSSRARSLVREVSSGSRRVQCHPSRRRLGRSRRGGGRREIRMPDAFTTALPLYRRGSRGSSPADTALRHDYARALSRLSGGNPPTSLAQYDTLLLRFPSPAWLIERAKLRVAMSGPRRCRADLTSAIAMRPTADAYFVRGELRRWNGRLEAARAEYERAVQLGDDAAIARRLATWCALRRPRCPALARSGARGNGVGWIGRAEWRRTTPGSRT